MAKETKQIYKKSYDSADWNKVSRTEASKELKEKDFEVLEKKGRAKTAKAIYVLK